MVTRPPVRYPGSKFRLASWLLKWFPEHDTYVEPFCGSASVLLRKKRARQEVINDRDEELVNVFRVLRDPAQSARLINLLSLTPFSRVEFEVCRLPTDDPVERARRTVARSFMGFSSTSVNDPSDGFRSRCYKCRVSDAGSWRTFPDSLYAVVDRLQGVVIECEPWEKMLSRHDHADVLYYLDPPYVRSTRTGLRWDCEIGKFYKHEMSDDDHRRLAEAAHALAGMVIVSGYPSVLYDEELYPDWLRVPRMANTIHGARRTEVLWVNPSAASRVYRTMSLDEA